MVLNWLFARLKTFLKHDAKVQRNAIDALNHLQIQKKLRLNQADWQKLGIAQPAARLLQAEQSIKEILQAIIDKTAAEKLQARQTEVGGQQCHLEDSDHEALFLALIKAMAILETLHPKTFLRLIGCYITRNNSPNMSLILLGL